MSFFLLIILIIHFRQSSVDFVLQVDSDHVRTILTVMVTIIMAAVQVVLVLVVMLVIVIVVVVVGEHVMRVISIREPPSVSLVPLLPNDCTFSTCT